MRYSIATLLLVSTWVAIAVCVVTPFLFDSVRNVYSGPVTDHPNISVSVFPEYDSTDVLRSTVSENDILKTPNWTSAAENPPFSAADAMQSADQLRRQLLKTNTGWDWNLESVSLVPLNSSGLKWCWRVDFRAVPIDHFDIMGVRPEFVAFVLMDGSTVIPKRYRRDDMGRYGVVVDDGGK